MRLLAIHSNVLFFGKAPNFYEWLADERGLIKRYKPLEGKYSQEKAKGPLLLKETYELVVGGLTLEKIREYCSQYCQEHLVQDTITRLPQIMKEIQVLVFSSYPYELYETVKDKGLAHKVFGTKGVVDTDDKIVTMIETKLEKVKAVREKMDEIGLGDKFSLELNRFGMLAYLIDEMIKNNLAKDDVVVLGKGDTAKPMHKVVGRVIESLNEV